MQSGIPTLSPLVDEMNKLAEEASYLRHLIGELESIEKGDLIAVVSEDIISIGKFERTVKGKDGTHIKLSNYAFVDITGSGPYVMRGGNEKLEERRRVSTMFLKGLLGITPSENVIQTYVNCCYPPVCEQPIIVKDSGINGILRPYKLSMRDYQALFQ